MSENRVLLAVLVAVILASSLLFGQFAYWTWQSRKEEEQKELARRIGTLQEAVAAPLIRFGSRAAGGDGIVAALEEILRSAGSPFEISTLYQRIAVSGVLGVVGLFLLLRSPVAIVGFAAGWIPVLLLNRAAERRVAKLTEQLPDGLDLLARSLQAGHGVGESMRMVAEEMAEPLAFEFGRVFEEQNLGRDPRECFQNLCRRNPRSFDLRIFVSSVLLQRDTGGNLVEILQNIAHTIRGRFVFQGKVQALTSEARFTAYVLGGLPFAIGTMIAVLSPDYLTPLFTDILGNFLIFIGASMFLTGVFIMREISKVDL
jgi:tight adherence protein B